MQRLLRLGCILMLAVCGRATSAQAQGASGSITGVVRDGTGGTLPGVTIEIDSPSLAGVLRTATTGDDGGYRVLGLPPGTYSVTYSLAGFAAVRLEGVTVASGFTATLNPELKVSAIEETITVKGQAQLIDRENVVHQTVLSRDFLDAIPTGAKSPLALAAVIPSVIVPVDAQDVGGDRGEHSVRLVAHGGLQRDQRLLIDGMNTNDIAFDGSGRFYVANPASISEMVVTTETGGAAEYATGGVQVNGVLRDGGDRFSSYLYATYTDHSMQGNNETDELLARGLRAGTAGLRNVYNVNGAFGGPLLRERLWFYSAHRRWGDRQRVANTYYNATADTMHYTPDFSRPFDNFSVWKSHNLRLAFRASDRDRLTWFGDWQPKCACFGTQPPTGNSSPEATTGLQFQPANIVQAKWTRAQSAALLFETGVTGAIAGWTTYLHDQYNDVQPGDVSILELSTNFRYNAPVDRGTYSTGTQTNINFATTYVKNGHQLKAGFTYLWGEATSQLQRMNEVSYTFNNGVPVTLTQYNNSTRTRRVQNPELGIFVQDKWSLGAFTLSAGLRFDYFEGTVPASSQPASLFVPARSFDRIGCVPCWKDWEPRLAGAYDLFGNGKTVVKANISRYVVSAAVTGIAAAADPVTSTVVSTNRSWTDVNGNFFPDCDLTNPQANTGADICGPYQNQSFGRSIVRAHFDPDYVNGTNSRYANWQTSVSLEQEVIGNALAVTLGYFRTWYSNFEIRDNLAVTPADYDPYCITAPVDSRLPTSVSGSQICGLYDVNPAKAGQVDERVTLASHYGKQTNIYNGVDVSLRGQLPKDITITGGINIGNGIGSGIVDSTNSSNRCFVVDSPQELRFCDQPVPYRTQFKMAVIVPLPYGLTASGDIQSLPGLAYRATLNVTNAMAQPSLGRPLSGGVAFVPIELIQPYTQFEDRINQIDLRLSKVFRVKGTTLNPMFDVYNVLNASSVLAVNQAWGPNWRQPQRILGARTFKVGARFEF